MFSLNSREVSSLLLQRKLSFVWADLASLSKAWSLLFIAAMLVMSLQTAGSFQRSFDTKLAFLYVYYYSSASEDIQNAMWWLPWPNNLVGRLGWYRQGLQEAAQYRTYIQSLATQEAPAILIAAAIANQGNSPQRPFGWDGFERMQAWLGYRFEWQLKAWAWAKAQWEDYFEAPSVGIGQIQSEEARRLVRYAGDRINLFNDQASISLMQAKLQNAYQMFQTLDLNQTELFALLALSNNDNSDGASTLSTFQRFNYDLKQWLSYDPASRIQLARMMTYLDYLHREECWELPNGVNTAYLWWLIHNARPMP
jgi:hypothetical protein